MSSTERVLPEEGDFKTPTVASEASLHFEQFSDIPTDCQDSHYLLKKNTESFRCLAQVLLSSSSLMKNRLFVFPPLENPGIEEVFDFVESAPTYDNVGVEKYKKLCKDYEIVPLSHIVKSLRTPTMDLQYYGLSKKQMQALMETLKGNVLVETLTLEDNFLTTEMVSMLSSMLEENGAIKVLNLRHCQIGEDGAGMLNDALSNSQFLSELDLSCNELTDQGLRLMMMGLCETPSLAKLNLSKNGLTEDCADALEKILLENKTLTELDLSWNGFYTAPGNKRLFNGLQKSDRITRLNLSWNGISTRPAMVPIAKYIRHAENLQFLDLSNNRLQGPSFRAARLSISKNHSLFEVKIGNNPYSAKEARDFVNMFSSKSKDPLYHVDMENIYLEKEAKSLVNRIRSSGKTIRVGGFLSDYIVNGPDYKKLLFDRCRYILQKPKKKKAKKDFAHLVLALPDQPIPTQDFEIQIKKKKMKKLDKDLLKELTAQFPAKKKRIDCPEMKMLYKGYYPDASLPPEKPKKKKKGKKGKHAKGKTTDETLVEEELKVHDLEVVSSAKELEVAPLEETGPEEKVQGVAEDGVAEQTDSTEPQAPPDEQEKQPDEVPAVAKVSDEFEGQAAFRKVLFSRDVITYNMLGESEHQKRSMGEYQEMSGPEGRDKDDEEQELRTIELDEGQGKRDIISSSFENKEIY